MNAEILSSIKRKESLIWSINKDFYLRNPNSLISLKKYIRKMEKAELVKVLKKYPKLKKVIILNSFNGVEIC